MYGYMHNKGLAVKQQLGLLWLILKHCFCFNSSFVCMCRDVRKWPEVIHFLYKLVIKTDARQTNLWQCYVGKATKLRRVYANKVKK